MKTKVMVVSASNNDADIGADELLVCTTPCYEALTKNKPISRLCGTFLNFKVSNS